MPVDAGTVLYRYRAERIIVATGAIEQPLVFPGNDLVGVMLPDAVRRLVRDFSIKPGQRAVVLASDDEALEIADDAARGGRRGRGASSTCARATRELAAHGRQGHGATPRRRRGCDRLRPRSSPRAAGSPPTRSSRRRVLGSSTTTRCGVFVPTELPDGIEAVGSVTGEGLPQRRAEPAYAGKGKCFVCVCEDVTTKDVKRAIGEGFDSIELSKRYTTMTMGPCQGKLCQLPSIRLYAQEHRIYESAIGTTTARPPWAPVELGLLAGASSSRRARTSLHFRHEEAGATIMWAGPWKRPYAYGEQPEDEVRAVHESLGVIDVSTLGKLLVEGPEAAELLERLYPNRFGDMQPGTHPLRRPHLGRRPDHGRRDDRAARRRPLLRHDDLDRRRRGDGVVRVVERGLGLRRGDRERHRRARGA